MSVFEPGSSKRQLVSKIIQDIKNGKLKWQKEGWLRCVQFVAVLYESRNVSVVISRETHGLRFLRKIRMFLRSPWGEVTCRGSVVSRDDKIINLDLTKEEKKFLIDFVENQLSHQESQEETILIKSLL